MLKALQNATIYFPGSTGVEEWNFSEQTRRWRRLAGWFLTGEIQLLHVADGALLAGGYHQALVLGANGSVVPHMLPWGSNLGSATATEGGWLVPAGEYGAVPLR